MGGSSSPPASSSQRTAPPLPLPSPSSSTVPFSWEQQPGVPKSREKYEDVGKASFLPLPPPPAPIGSSFRSTPTRNKIRHAPTGSDCRKIKQQQQVHLTRLFPVTDSHSLAQKAIAKSGDDDPFSLALARCAEEARRPNSTPFRLPSPTPRSRRSAPTSSTWRSNKTTKGYRGGAARLASAFRPLDLYGSCRFSNAGGACRSSVVDSTVNVPRRSSTSYVNYGQQNRKYVAYAILYGRHG